MQWKKLFNTMQNIYSIMDAEILPDKFYFPIPAPHGAVFW